MATYNQRNSSRNRLKPDVQALLKKVSVRLNHEYTEEYPAKMPAKITVRLQDGKVIEHHVQDHPPRFSSVHMGDSVEKFDRPVAGRADKGLSEEIKDAVRLSVASRLDSNAATRSRQSSCFGRITEDYPTNPVI